ncbi:MAG: cation diffusion facilitator family transporter [Burkholderiales bacterium]
METVNVERWGWYSVGLNVVLAALHATVASVSGSLAVTAELAHNLIDLASALAVLAGLKLAARKSPAFPYGLYKLENVAALGLALLIFFSAYEIARESLFAPAASVHVQGWMLAVLAATGVLPLAFSHFELRVGRAAGSPALIADAREYRVHVLTTGLAFAALASQWLGFALDRIAAVFIVIAVVWTGWGLLRDAMRVLLDASLDAQTLLEVRGIIESDPAVTEAGWITGRNSGRFRFVEAGVTLRTQAPDKTADVVRRVEREVRERVTHVERVLLHVEPAQSPYIRHAVALEDAAGTLSGHFGAAPYFAIITLRRGDGAVAEQRIVANPHLGIEKARGITVARWLVAQKIDTLILRLDLDGKGPEYVLRDAGVELQRTDARVLADLLPPTGQAGGLQQNNSPGVSGRQRA